MTTATSRHADKPRFRQRIALVGPAVPEREFARRAIHELGHSVFLFDDMRGLEAIGQDARRFAMAVLVDPRSMATAMPAIRSIHRFLGAGQPLLVFVRSAKGVSRLHAHAQSIDVAVAPANQRAVRLVCAGFMKQHGLPIAGDDKLPAGARRVMQPDLFRPAAPGFDAPRWPVEPIVTHASPTRRDGFEIQLRARGAAGRGVLADALAESAH